MMTEAILNFPKQFEFSPKVEFASQLTNYKSFVVCGMGGSHLSADILQNLEPEIDLQIHSDYGLPEVALTTERSKNTLFIFSSYSGNTEETIDGYLQARSKKLSSAVIAVGGQLLALAQKDGVPYIKLPQTGIQPRSALGFSLIALATLLAKKDILLTLKKLTTELEVEKMKSQGQEIASEISGFVPLIYTSQKNKSLGYNWKIKLNETGKIPAFYNVVPELNHNEMTGFDLNDKSKYLTDRFYILFLLDSTDNPRNKKRLEVLFQLYHERRLPVRNIYLEGETKWLKYFNSLLLADWTAVSIARYYGHEEEQVPMVEEFKKRITN